MTRRLALLASMALIASVAAPPAHAMVQTSDGFFRTGYGIRKKTVAIVKVDVYMIAHYAKPAPTQKSKQAMIDLQTEKRFSWSMLRDVTKDQIAGALRGGYEMNGYKDDTKISKFVGAFDDLKKGQTVSIWYTPSTKTTNLSVTGGRSASVQGDDFMRATWSIWFGKIDQPSLGDDLIKEIP